MKEYSYQPADHDSLLEVIRWCQNNLSLRDWTITLDTGHNTPRKLMPGDPHKFEGRSHIDSDRLFALIWLPIGHFPIDDCGPIEVCMHEMTHVFNADQGLVDDEQLTRILSPLLYRTYCYENGIEMAKEKQIE